MERSYSLNNPTNVQAVPTIMPSPPFVGRANELQTIREFCENAVGTDNLAIQWISGEAGMGKSALVQQAEQMIANDRYVVLTVRLYPDLTGALHTLLADVVNTNRDLRKIIRTPAQPSLASVTETVRKVIRLRPTVLILEDVHLLDQQGTGDLCALIQNLKNLPVGILCTTRPGHKHRFSRLFSWIVSNLELDNLRQADIETMLGALNITPTADIAGILQEATNGMPLLVRSIIPQLFSIPEEVRGLNMNLVRRIIFGNAEKSIQGIAMNFLDPLDELQTQAARQLSTLGEAFSPEAAEIILDDDSILGVLAQQGVLVQTSRFYRPLFGKETRQPLWTFAHSLLHEQLVSGTTPDPDKLISLFEKEVNIYSTLPLRLLASSSPQFQSAEQSISLLRWLLRQFFNMSPDQFFQYSVPRAILESISGIFEAESHRFPEDARTEIQLYLASGWLKSVYLFKSPAKETYLQQYLDLSASPKSLDTAVHRSLALMLYYEQRSDRNKPIPSRYIAEVPALAEQFPDLLYNEKYLALIGRYISAAARKGSEEFARARTLYQQAYEKEGSLERNSTGLAFAGICIMEGLTVDTPEQIAEWEDFGEMVHGLIRPETASFMLPLLYSKLAIDYIMFAPLKALSLINTAFKALPAVASAPFGIEVLLIRIRLALGTPLDQLEQDITTLSGEIHAFASDAPDSSMMEDLVLLASTIRKQCFFVDEVEWGRRIRTTVVEKHTPELPAALIVEPLEMLMEGRFPELADSEHMEIPELQKYHQSLEICFGRDGNVGDATTELLSLINFKGASIERATETRVAIRLLEELHTLSALDLDEFRPEIQASIEYHLNWTISEGALGYAQPFLSLASAYLSEKACKAWTKKNEAKRKKIEKMPGLEAKEPPATLQPKPSVNVIGAVAIAGEEGVPQTVQGGRVRHTIALIAANQLMRTPLTLPEFRELATGMDPDSDRIGNYTRTLLWRIRSVIGQKAIEVDGESAPRFAREHVYVDILETNELLGRCEEAIQARHPRTAKETLLQALDIVGEGPVYPSLYDEFFEAARSDFEFRLRECVLDTVELLHKENDQEEAERLLRKSLEFMPGDDELAEQLIRLLKRLGRNTEAVSLQKRWELELEKE